MLAMLLLFIKLTLLKFWLRYILIVYTNQTLSFFNFSFKQGFHATKDGYRRRDVPILIVSKIITLPKLANPMMSGSIEL